MVGRAQMGRGDRCLCQAFPASGNEILGGVPTLILGDFGQLPPIGDTPLFSDKKFTGGSCASLLSEGRTVYENFQQSVTLKHIYHQEGNDPEQVAFCDALLRLWSYSTTEADYQLFSNHMWNNLSQEEHASFKDALHLLPTKAAVIECNHSWLAATAQPVVRCAAKHHGSSAHKASVDDAQGLEPMVLLAEGAKVMLTRNLWTSKGVFSMIYFSSSVY